MKLCDGNHIKEKNNVPLFQNNRISLSVVSQVVTGWVTSGGIKVPGNLVELKNR